MKIFKHFLRDLLSKCQIDLLILIFMRIRLRTRSSKVRVVTNHPIAVDSDDHKHPVGSINDNYADRGFILALLEEFPALERFCDLGCAGGELVAQLDSLGVTAVGVEGSSKVLLGSGRRNWIASMGSNLFFADISKKFQVLEDGQLMKFDVVHAEEVFEHLTETQVISTLENIQNLMRDTSVLLLGISLNDDCRVIRNGAVVNLHKSVRPASWWLNLFSKNGFEPLKSQNNDANVFGWPIKNTNRSSNADSMFFGLKLKP